MSGLLKRCSSTVKPLKLGPSPKLGTEGQMRNKRLRARGQLPAGFPAQVPTWGKPRRPSTSLEGGVPQAAAQLRSNAKCKLGTVSHPPEKPHLWPDTACQSPSLPPPHPYPVPPAPSKSARLIRRSIAHKKLMQTEGLVFS